MGALHLKIYMKIKKDKKCKAIKITMMVPKRDNSVLKKKTTINKITLLFCFLNIGNTETVLASHVLQFIFLSDSGFRFPVVQFPSHNCSACDLYTLFWDGVLMMRENCFT